MLSGLPDSLAASVVGGDTGVMVNQISSGGCLTCKTFGDTTFPRYSTGSSRTVEASSSNFPQIARIAKITSMRLPKP